MSILGNLGGMVGNLLQQHGGAEAVLTQALNQVGGVQGVLDKLRKAGLGDQVSSWLGTGPNEPVTPESIGNAIGQGKLGEMAAKLGIPQDQLSQMIAHTLPGLIDKISPNGTVQPHLLQDGSAGPASPSAPAS